MEAINYQRISRSEAIIRWRKGTNMKISKSVLAVLEATATGLAKSSTCRESENAMHACNIGDELRQYFGNVVANEWHNLYQAKKLQFGRRVE